ncbi:hypothetical protein QWZ16_14175 [Vibrio ostreicida]|uniref:Uncharacterized protein n=1 Tax=Vibrio ostreicida TaxID=526588 RepID=A0ABT8BV61_9VIBR|nr:hypothetical protein [Vibrio ostreicida]MDN3610848.1 hypothetical protein [Vibrio ostreicida]
MAVYKYISPLNEPFCKIQNQGGFHRQILLLQQVIHHKDLHVRDFSKF